MRLGNVVFQFFMTPQEPNTLNVVNGEQLERELKTYFPKSQITLLDQKYKIYTLQDMTKLIEFNQNRQRKWIWDTYDCDNYAKSNWALINDILGNPAFGFATIKNHALNLMRCTDGQWYWIDNKNNTNEIFHIGSAKAIVEGYTLQKIMI